MRVYEFKGHHIFSRVKDGHEWIISLTSEGISAIE